MFSIKVLSHILLKNQGNNIKEQSLDLIIGQNRIMLNVIYKSLILWISEHKTQTIILFLFAGVGSIILLRIVPHYEYTLKIIEMILVFISILIHIPAFFEWLEKKPKNGKLELMTRRGHEDDSPYGHIETQSIALQGEKKKDKISEHLTPVFVKETVSADERKSALRERSNRLINRGPTVESGNYYYFYISLDKIEKIENTPPSEQKVFDETVDVTLRETSAGFGRYEEYRLRCKRLHDLLAQFGTSQQIQDLTKMQHPVSVKEGWAYAEIKLRVRERTQNLLILEGKMDKYMVLLSCSQSYFFDFDPIKNEISYTSTNQWFMDGKAEYTFRSHFWVLSVDKDELCILGSPVYLSLPIGILSA